MIENDMIRHTRRTFELLKSKGRNISHKTLEIFTEILIIIVAVTLSIALHNWSAHRHDVKEEREFLTGLKTDLQHDIENL